MIFDYLSRRRQRVKINDTLSKWSNIEYGVPQGSLLGPLLFNIFINDIFYFMNNTKITNYADDNTPYICVKNIDTALNILESDGNTIFNWFAENFFKANANKSHLIVTKKPEGYSVTIGNDTISCSAEEKLLGIYIDYELKFENHVKHLCKRSNQKLLALSRIAPFINTEKLKVLMRGNAVGNIKTTTYGTETMRYRAPLTWEMVPEHIKQSQSLSEFKTKIKSWIPEGCKCNLCETYLNGVGFI